ncbi:hypothetical protein TNCT_85501 [Trichonephila clavata]|uniref:Uncharacterized protein n=1 Tax=Trichonephila clavata TaxID=2740835 RepID=A0A8X6L373_TRICU|nr:hypothetical protein TNCT_85501 [Trichonephila clavata]
MSDGILMSTFVLLHSLWCLFEIFGHFNLQYFLHLIPYYIFIELLKLNSRNLKTELQNTDQEVNICLVNTQLEERIEMNGEIADNKSIQNFEKNETDTTKEDQTVSDISDISIREDTDKIRSFKKFTPFTQRSNISGPTEQTSAHSTEITHTLVKYSKYVFSDDKGDKFLIDNAEFEEEEKELIDIFNSNLEILPSNPFYERGSYNENYHFIPIPDSPDNPSDEDVKENNMLNNHNNVNSEILPSNPFYVKGSYNEDYHFTPIPLNTSTGNYTDEDVKENNMPNNPNLEILPSNPFYEMSSYYEGYQFTPIPSNTSTGNYTDEDVKENNMLNNVNLEILPSNPFYERDRENYSIPISVNTSPSNHMNEDVQENAVDFSRKKNVFKKMKSFFKKLRNDNCNGFAYKKFK